MNERRITKNQILLFVSHLNKEERSNNTIEKYIRDIKVFCGYIGEAQVTKKRFFHITYSTCSKKFFTNKKYEINNIKQHNLYYVANKEETNE